MIFFLTQKLDKMKLKAKGVASRALDSWASDEIEMRVVSLQEE